jgi:hypothetical protein
MRLWYGELVPSLTQPRRHPDVTYQQLPDGTGVLVHAATGEAVAINATAAFVWARCDGAHTTDHIVAALLERYNTDEDRARESVRVLLTDLAARGLVEQSAGTPPGTPPSTPPGPPPSTPPGPPR